MQENFGEMAAEALGNTPAQPSAPAMPQPEFNDQEDGGITAFDNASLTDPSIGMNALANAPKPSTDELPRFAMSFLLPIPLYRMHGNNSYGDFNPKNERGQNRVNHNYYPPFAIMPLMGGDFTIPFEPHVTVSENEPKPEPFNEQTFLTNPPSGFSSIRRSPRECADIYLRETQSLGGTVIHSLTGYHVTDEDRGLKACKDLLEVIMPSRTPDVMPSTTRVKNGVPFKGPFLDELLLFVKQNGISRLSAAGYNVSDLTSIPIKVYNEVLAYLNTNIQRANRILNATEAEMKNPSEIKKSYDAPNLEIPEAPVSVDLYCLAHTDRTEIDDKQLKASENIGRGFNEPMVEAVRQMTEAVTKMGGGVPTQGVLTMEQVQTMMDDQRAEMMEKFQTELTAISVNASASIANPPVIDPQTPLANDPPADGGKGGNKGNKPK